MPCTCCLLSFCPISNMCGPFLPWHPLAPPQSCDPDHRHVTPQTSVQFSSVTQLCPTLCDPMNCSMPGLPVHHQLTEFTQTLVHIVGDANQPSHPLSSPSSPAPNPSQHQSFPISQLFTWGDQSIRVSALASVLPRTPRTDLLYDGLVVSPCSPRDSQESSPTPQFKSISLWHRSEEHTSELQSR